jgi:hypothetical protein
VPGLLRKADRQLWLVLVKLPLELMCWPALLTMATSTWPMAVSSSARPLTKIRASVKAVPSVGENSVSLRVGSRSPG